MSGKTHFYATIEYAGKSKSENEKGILEYKNHDNIIVSLAGAEERSFDTTFILILALELIRMERFITAVSNLIARFSGILDL